MTVDAQTQQIASNILAFALQAKTVEEGIGRVYDLIIAWADQVSLDAVFAYNETRLDQQRSEEARQKYPARAYLRFWSVARLREEPVHDLNQRLMEQEYQPQRVPIPAVHQDPLSEADLASFGRALASSLSIDQALDFFETLVIRYASLVDREKVRQSAEPGRQPGGWTEEDAFRAVFGLLYYHVIDPISARGIWREGSS